MENMQINSTTFFLGETDHKALEEIIVKVAHRENIANVESVTVYLDADAGVIRFREAECGKPIQKSKKKKETSE